MGQMQAAHQFEDELRVALVQIPRRLVCQEQFRLIHQGACDSHALLLSAGKFSGALMIPTPQAHFA